MDKIQIKQIKGRFIPFDITFSLVRPIVEDLKFLLVFCLNLNFSKRIQFDYVQNIDRFARQALFFFINKRGSYYFLRLRHWYLKC